MRKHKEKKPAFVRLRKQFGPVPNVVEVQAHPQTCHIKEELRGLALAAALGACPHPLYCRLGPPRYGGSTLMA